MTKIIIGTDCGNSPKREFLKELNIAFVKSNTGFLTECVTDDIIWDIIGHRKINGKEEFFDELEIMKNEEVAELVLNNIITHGKDGAANGIIKMGNGKVYAFSDFYKFNSAKGNKIKSITSYVIEES